MSNRTKTQDECNKLFREAALFGAMWRFHEDARRKCDPSNARIKVLELGNTNKFTSNWKLKGLKIGTIDVGAGKGNTTERGELFVRILDETPSAAHATINIYKATGGGGSDKVSTGNGADSTTFALTDPTSDGSGITGTVDVGVVTANESTDSHVLQAYPDWPSRLNSIFDNSDPAHETCRLALLGAIGGAGSALADAVTKIEAAFTVWLSVRWKPFWGATSPVAFAAKPDNTAGLISYLFTGTLEDGRRNMIDNTPTAQAIVKNVLTPTGAAFDSRNQGVGAMGAPTVAEWAEPGKFTLECDTSIVGQERFTVSFVRDRDGATLVAANKLTVKKNFQDATLGISNLLLTRTFTLPAGSTNDFKTVASWTLDGESPTNTADGDIFLQIVKSGTSWILNAYTTASLDPAKQVFTTPATAAGGTAVIQAKGIGGAISGQVIIGDTPTDGHTGTFRFNVWRRSNSNGVADRIEFSISLTSRGLIQTFFTEIFGYGIASTTAGAETINENYMRAGSIPDYSPEDV